MPTVLITGLNGFVGAHIGLAFLGSFSAFLRFLLRTLLIQYLQLIRERVGVFYLTLLTDADRVLLDSPAGRFEEPLGLKTRLTSSRRPSTLKSTMTRSRS